jgi:predicted nucleic-acid-binding protein
MRAVDANVLVRLVTGDDRAQARHAEAFISKGAWVSLLALAESTWVLETVYDRNAAEIATTIDMLLNHLHLTVQDADVARSALDDFRRRPSLGYSDCLMLAVGRKAGHVPLGTFDRNLARLEGTHRL